LILFSLILFFRGILLFLIFGAKKQAALFLPFCYYVSPDRPTRCPDEQGSIYMENDGISPALTAKVIQDDDVSIELDSLKINGSSSSD
jgi:hypothetical protein